MKLYGLAVHEAICSGVPVIVSATAGIAERMPSDLGDLLLDDVNSAADLSRRLQRWRAQQDAFRDGRARLEPCCVSAAGTTWHSEIADMSES